MEIKTFEIRDEGTFIPAIAIAVAGTDGYLMRRAGYGSRCILLMRANGGQCTYDAYDWSGSRTMHVAHKYIKEHWDELVDSQVIDVAFIIGVRSEPSKPEQEEMLAWHE